MTNFPLDFQVAAELVVSKHERVAQDLLAESHDPP